MAGEQGVKPVLLVVGDQQQAVWVREASIVEPPANLAGLGVLIGQFLGNYGPLFDAIDRERQPASSEDLPSTRTPPASSTTLDRLKNRSARGPCDEFRERSMVGRLNAMDNAFCPAKSQDDGLSSPPRS